MLVLSGSIEVDIETFVLDLAGQEVHCNIGVHADSSLQHFIFYVVMRIVVKRNWFALIYWFQSILGPLSILGTQE